MNAKCKHIGCLVAATVWLAAVAPASAQNPRPHVIEGEAAEMHARALGLPVRVDHADGTTVMLKRFVDGRPEYYTTNNAVAASTVRTDVTRTQVTDLTLHGTGVALGVWDGGSARLTHQEFAGRVTTGDGSSAHPHSTHVTGTMIASGVVASARGMAPGGSVVCYDFNNDDAEMLAESLTISNHSYGSISGWHFNPFGDNEWYWFAVPEVSSDEDPAFGLYESGASTWDDIAYVTPGYLIVKSAGNDRGQGPPPGTSHFHLNATGTAWVFDDDTHPLDGPYDCVPTAGVAKNILTVGAVEDIPGGWTESADVVMTSFSGWGPTDDGRIKPDIVANGASLTSAISLADNAYGESSGTSMAAPNASGSAAVLQDYWDQLHTEPDNPPSTRSASLKGLIIHTAREAGSADGPDYVFGWGLMDTLGAAVAIKHDRYWPRAIQELVLPDPDPLSPDPDVIVQRLSDIRVGQHVKVTICWTDPPHASLGYQLDPSTRVLINDLDLRLIHVGSGTVYYPWTLNPASPGAAAEQDADNDRDNVEVVEFTATQAGDYLVEVTYKDTLENDEQEFSLLVNTYYANVWSLPDDFGTLSAALNSSSVDDWSALLLESNAYPENLTITKPVTIYAAGGIATIGVND